MSEELCKEQRVREFIRAVAQLSPYKNGAARAKEDAALVVNYLIDRAISLSEGAEL